MTANPAAYVPREASRLALEALVAALESGAPVVALAGPPGLGKTLLTRLLEPRVRGRRTLVYLPYSALPASDLCHWALRLLGAPTQGEAAPALARAARERAARGEPLVLVVDDASALPLETARGLAQLAAENPGALFVLVAITDDDKSEAVLAAFGRRLHTVRLDTPLTADESFAYVLARLERADGDRTTCDAASTPRCWSGCIWPAMACRAS